MIKGTIRSLIVGTFICFGIYEGDDQGHSPMMVEDFKPNVCVSKLSLLGCGFAKLSFG